MYRTNDIPRSCKAAFLQNIMHNSRPLHTRERFVQAVFFGAIKLFVQRAAWQEGGLQAFFLNLFPITDCLAQPVFSMWVFRMGYAALLPSALIQQLCLHSVPRQLTFLFVVTLTIMEELPYDS